jgi:serine/threonine protein kinase
MSCFQVLPSNIIVRPYKVVETEARGFFKQLLSGIACIHDNGFCHRDIKPENCMVRPGRYCSPHHPTHFQPSFTELRGLL